MKQKIEGGWEERFDEILSTFWFRLKLIDIPDVNHQMEVVKSKAIESLTQELKKAVASERQRCVENLKGVGLMLEEYKCGEHKKVHKVIKQLIDQAKHNLEQLK